MFMVDVPMAIGNLSLNSSTARATSSPESSTRAWPLPCRPAESWLIANETSGFCSICCAAHADERIQT